MATVCAATLALLDGGAPLIRPAAGIAMGLVKEGTGSQYSVTYSATRITSGIWTSKVAGTRDGISAFQMDIKIRGISLEIMRRGRWSRPGKAGCTS